jgi:predicted ferric reductase
MHEKIVPFTFMIMVHVMILKKSYVFLKALFLCILYMLFGGRLYIYSVPAEKERKKMMGKDRGKERILIRDHL